MAKVRDFLGAFCVAAVVLMALVSFVFLGSALMSEFVTIADLGNNLIAAAIVSALLAVPVAAVGSSSRHFGSINANAA